MKFAPKVFPSFNLLFSAIFRPFMLMLCHLFAFSESISVKITLCRRLVAVLPLCMMKKTPIVYKCLIIFCLRQHATFVYAPDTLDATHIFLKQKWWLYVENMKFSSRHCFCNGFFFLGGGAEDERTHSNPRCRIYYDFKCFLNVWWCDVRAFGWHWHKTVFAWTLNMNIRFEEDDCVHLEICIHFIFSIYAIHCVCVCAQNIYCIFIVVKSIVYAS